MQMLGLVHLLLEVVGLLLWLRWREDMLQSSRRLAGSALLTTLKKAGTARAYRWTFLGLLGGLILVRAVAYRQLGPRLGWTPEINVCVLPLYFRSDLFVRMLLFSFFSQIVFLAKFYYCLVLLSALNRKVTDTDSLQNRVRAHVGWVDRWPGPLKLLWPFLVGGLIWALFSPLFAELGFFPSSKTFNQSVEQAAVMGLAAYLVWKYLIAGFLLLYLIASYIYFGRSPFWAFIHVTGRNLLQPIQWIPLRLGRIDLAPLVVSALVLFLADRAEHWLPNLYQHLLL